MAGHALKILYLMVEDTAGTLAIFQKQHQALGNECRYVTLFRSPEGFPRDIELNLPLMPSRHWFKSAKSKFYSGAGLYAEAPGFPPTWEAKSWAEKAFFNSGIPGAAV